MIPNPFQLLQPPHDPTGSESIFLIDDEESIALIEKLILGCLGYKVTHRTNSIDAFEVLKANPSSIDLVISDMTYDHAGHEV